MPGRDSLDPLIRYCLQNVGATFLNSCDGTTFYGVWAESIANCQLDAVVFFVNDKVPTVPSRLDP